MSLDLAALRNKLKELSGAASRDDVLWKPTEGDNTVRIVPLKDHPENPFIELYFHYLGNKTYLSPMSFGEPDPIAEFADSLRAGGGLTKQEWAETKKFVPQRRTFVPVIDRKKPGTVKFWAFGKTVYGELLTSMADPDYGDITDPQTGRDIKVTFTPQEKSDTNFAKTSVRLSPKESVLTKDADELEKYLNEQPDLMSLYKKYSYDELKAVLESFINGGSSSSPSARKVVEKTDDDWGEDVSASPSAQKARTTASKKVVSDVEDDFAQMFEK